jgi:hypothetical protein
MFLLSFIFLFLVLTTPLFYALILLAVSLLVVCISVLGSSISSLLGLLILLVYYGAIIILISYVCSVSPNLNYDLLSVNNPVFISTLFLVGRSFLGVFLPGLSLSAPSSPLMVSFFYSLMGSFRFLLVCILIIIVLFFCSTYTQVSSPFRSV